MAHLDGWEAEVRRVSASHCADLVQWSSPDWRFIRSDRGSNAISCSGWMKWQISILLYALMKVLPMGCSSTNNVQLAVFGLITLGDSGACDPRSLVPFLKFTGYAWIFDPQGVGWNGNISPSLSFTSFGPNPYSPVPFILKIPCFLSLSFVIGIFVLQFCLSTPPISLCQHWRCSEAT